MEVVRNVPGPERVVQVEDTSRVQQLTEDNRQLKKRVTELESKPAEILEKEIIVEKIVEVEKEVPVEVERAASGDLRQAARLLASSMLNKEDLTADEIFEILQKSSQDDVKRKLGFWAVPLPKQGDTENITNTDKRYIGKRP